MDRTADLPAPPLDALRFRVGAKELGIDLRCVAEVRPHQRPVQVAGTPAYVPGVLPIAGRLLPIVDLRSRYGLAPTSHEDRKSIVAIRTSTASFGLVVDDIVGPVDLRGLALLPPPRRDGDDGDPDCITALCPLPGRDGERLLILVDAVALVGRDALARIATLPRRR